MKYYPYSFSHSYLTLSSNIAWRSNLNLSSNTTWLFNLNLSSNIAWWHKLILSSSITFLASRSDSFWQHYLLDALTWRYLAELGSLSSKFFFFCVFICRLVIFVVLDKDTSKYWYCLFYDSTCSSHLFFCHLFSTFLLSFFFFFITLQLTSLTVSTARSEQF